MQEQEHVGAMVVQLGVRPCAVCSPQATQAEGPEEQALRLRQREAAEASLPSSNAQRQGAKHGMGRLLL